MPPLTAHINIRLTSSQVTSGMSMSRSSSCFPADSAYHRDTNASHFCFSGCKTYVRYSVRHLEGPFDMSNICSPFLLLHLRLHCTVVSSPASRWLSRCRSCMPQDFQGRSNSASREPFTTILRLPQTTVEINAPLEKCPSHSFWLEGLKWALQKIGNRVFL